MWSLPAHVVMSVPVIYPKMYFLFCSGLFLLARSKVSYSSHSFHNLYLPFYHLLSYYLGLPLYYLSVYQCFDGGVFFWVLCFNFSGSPILVRFYCYIYVILCACAFSCWFLVRFNPPSLDIYGQGWIFWVNYLFCASLNCRAHTFFCLPW